MRSPRQSGSAPYVGVVVALVVDVVGVVDVIDDDDADAAGIAPYATVVVDNVIVVVVVADATDVADVVDCDCVVVVVDVVAHSLAISYYLYRLDLGIPNMSMIYSLAPINIYLALFQLQAKNMTRGSNNSILGQYGGCRLLATLCDPTSGNPTPVDTLTALNAYWIRTLARSN